MKIFSKIKAVYDTHKIIMFIVSFFVVGTNAMQAGVQEYVRTEPVEVVEPVKVVTQAKPIHKTTVIYKNDEQRVKELIEIEFEKHFESPRH